MKVKELLDKLTAFDGELDVVGYCEDEGIPAPKHGFRLFDIEYIDSTDAESAKGADMVPSFRLGKTDESKKYITIVLTSDF